MWRRLSAAVTLFALADAHLGSYFMMKLAIVVGALVCSAAGAQQAVPKKAYVTKQGVYVPPSHTTAPNDTKVDNFSTRGNVNPYTGKHGTVDPYKLEPLQVPRPSKASK
jgi:hypothetical protein